MKYSLLLLVTIKCFAQSTFAGRDDASFRLLDDPFADWDYDWGGTDALGSPHEEWDEDFDYMGEFDKSLSDLKDMGDIITSEGDHNQASSDIDIDQNGACKADLAAHAECAVSKNDKGVCLWMTFVDNSRGLTSKSATVSPECKSYLIDFFTNATAHPFAYFHDMRVECESDIKAQCSNSTKEVTVLACLRANFNDLQNQNCKDEITHLNSWASLNENWWSPTLWKDCANERKGICANYTSTGLSDFRDCLDDHRFELSPNCHRSLFESDLQAAPNPFLMRKDLTAKCKKETSHFCHDVASYGASADESHLFCLFMASKVEANQFAPECAEAIASVVKIIESDYRLNIPIRKFCKSTIDEFCAAEKRENDKADFENDDVLTCLKRVYLFSEHRERESHDAAGAGDSHDLFARNFEKRQETEACMQAVRESVLLSSLDWEIDSSIHSNCWADLQRLGHLSEQSAKKQQSSKYDVCNPKSDAGAAPICLQTFFDEIQDQSCKKAIVLNSQLASLDSDFKPELLKSCALVLDNLNCAENASEDPNNLIDCLYTHFEQIPDPVCRAAISKDYELSDRDYRLSYSLAMVCAADSESLCGDQAPEKVLQCMIDHVDEIKDTDCQDDVTKMSLVAVVEGGEKIGRSVCATDVNKFCAAITGGTSTHSCLLAKIESVSAPCAEELLNLHSSAASQAAMDTLLNAACTDVLVSEKCKHLVHRSGEPVKISEKVECIERAMGGRFDWDFDEYSQSTKSQVSPQCRSQLRAVQSLLTADYRTNPELARDCESDLKNVCPSQFEATRARKGVKTASTEHTTYSPSWMHQPLAVPQYTPLVSNEALMCLVAHKLELRNQQCKQHIISSIYRMGEDTGMQAACFGDIQKFCANSPVGNGQLHACLREHLGELSYQCLAQEFALEQAEELSAPVRRYCKSELTDGVCKLAQSNPLHCLWMNVDADISPACKTEIKKEMKGRIGNIYLDISLYGKCRSTVNGFVTNGGSKKMEKCPSYLAVLPPLVNGKSVPLPTNYTQAINGEHIACLASNRASIRDYGCLSAVEKVLQEEVKDPLLLRFGMKTQCRSDLSVNGVCGKADPFDTVDQFRCLEDHIDSLSFTCGDAVKRVWRLSITDVKFNPDVAQNCAKDIDANCATKGNVYECLTALMPTEGSTGATTAENTNTAGDAATTAGDADTGVSTLSEGCLHALKRLKELPSKAGVKSPKEWSSTRRNKTVGDSDEDSVAFRELKQNSAETSSPTDFSIALTGPLAFASLGSLFIVLGGGLYKLIKWKFFNKGYVVVVQKE